jgi:hypothetical protein
MSKSAVFKNGIDISGALDVSGNMTLLGILDVSATLNLHGVDIPSLPIDLCGQLLAVDNNGIGLEWIKSDAVGGSATISTFYETACTDVTTSRTKGGSGTSNFYTDLLVIL